MRRDLSIHLALASIRRDHPHDQLWSLSDREIVWSYNKMADVGMVNRYAPFFEHASECVQLRSHGTIKPSLVSQENGRWLYYYPYHAMFEDVTIEETRGFFGSGDCPPPAFWTHIEQDILVSFIPAKYIPLATIGVDLCVNETLLWGMKDTGSPDGVGTQSDQSGR